MTLLTHLPSRRGRPADVRCDAEEPALALRTDRVYVAFTTIEHTSAGLLAALRFARPLDVPVALVHIRAVPYAQPIDVAAGVSPIATDAFSTYLGRQALEVRRTVYVCREISAAIRAVLPARSLVFVGTRRGWPADIGGRMHRALETAGHFVVSVEGVPVEENDHA